jgi:HlyD family secretion protein
LDLDRAIIRSPVDGIVINRNVDLGQTVAASLQAPVLFTIAEDLARMQVEVSVDEADIGRVRVAQRVKFTVDAYATREFTGEVLQIRKSPREVSNVVTYMVIVDSANPDLALLPGMTANVEIVIGERKDVLKVPDAALRFTPPSAAAESDTKSAGPGGGREAAIARMRALMKNLVERLKLNDAQQSAVRAIFMETGQAIGALRQDGGDPEQLKPMIKSMRDQAATRIAALLDDGQRKIYAGMRAAAAAAAEVRRGRVWILDAEGKPEAVPLRIGISDGSMSQILTKKLGVGVEVIVSKASAAARK